MNLIAFVTNLILSPLRTLKDDLFSYFKFGLHAFISVTLVKTSSPVNSINGDKIANRKIHRNYMTWAIYLSRVRKVELKLNLRQKQLYIPKEYKKIIKWFTLFVA